MSSPVGFSIPRTSSYLPTNSGSILLKALLKPTNGSETKAFEQAMANYCGVRFAFATTSGTTALLMSLLALDFKPGSEVILPSYMVPEVADAIIAAQLKPVFVDIEPNSFNIDPARAQEAITPQTCALLAPHLYGKPCALKELKQIAEQSDLLLIEDLAQAIGARYHKQTVGTFGHIATLSLGSMKTLNTLGGGFILTNDATLASRIENIVRAQRPPTTGTILKRYAFNVSLGMLSSRAPFTLLTFPLICTIDRLKPRLLYELLKARNDSTLGTGEVTRARMGRLSETQATLGLVGIKNLDENNDRRRSNGLLLSALLSHAGIPAPQEEAFEHHVFTNFVLATPNRHGFEQAMRRRGVDTTSGYIPSLSSMSQFPLNSSPSPVSDALASMNLYLPIHPSLSEKAIRYVANCVIEISESNPDLKPVSLSPFRKERG